MFGVEIKDKTASWQWYTHGHSFRAKLLSYPVKWSVSEKQKHFLKCLQLGCIKVLGWTVLSPVASRPLMKIEGTRCAIHLAHLWCPTHLYRDVTFASTQAELCHVASLQIISGNCPHNLNISTFDYMCVGSTGTLHSWMNCQWCWMGGRHARWVGRQSTFSLPTTSSGTVREWSFRL